MEFISLVDEMKLLYLGIQETIYHHFTDHQFIQLKINELCKFSIVKKVLEQLEI